MEKENRGTQKGWNTIEGEDVFCEKITGKNMSKKITSWKRVESRETFVFSI